jgi:Phosphoserine phosphatase RsbU, N-terminal domain
VTEFAQSYASAFADYLRGGAEGALQAAYELGREAVRRDLSVLDLATIHHETLRSELGRASRAQEPEEAIGAANDFFLESLSSYEILRRGYREAREEALFEKRQAAIVRQLSSFLGDASLALSATDALREVVQLVAEHAREIIGARRCVVRVEVGEGLETVSEAEGGWDTAAAKLAVPLTGLDGRKLGMVELFDKNTGEFTEVDEAVLVHLAQMASAAVERTQLYLKAAH